MEKILGIDTGTNSNAWAIIERNEEGCHLLEKGVEIFQEGVKIEKGIESSKAAERTLHKGIRIRYYRLRLRKIRLLKILSDNHLCPPISSQELSDWRLKNIYPQNELFMKWQSTDDNLGINPYYYRHKCLHEKLDLNDVMQRYELGRALYHITQRRGFLSNRKNQNSEEEGKVKEAINTLTREMQSAGFEFIGDYFYHLYNKGEKIRNHYTSRIEHYLKEFNAICEKQELNENLMRKLEKAIFYQRPLKSQKRQVGKCVFERNKTRCPLSHPLYEEYRMLSFINNIKIRTPQDDTLRPLNQKERELIKPLFYRKSKRNFEFEDIAKKIAGNKNYGHYKTNSEKAYLFNYYMDSPVSGCIVTSQLKNIFGENWEDNICEVYTLNKNKTKLQIVNDIWHALFFYSDKTKLKEFAQKRLQLDNDEAKKFSEITLPNDYASLSLKAICKILPFLRRGLIYSHAVFLANLGKIIPKYEWSNLNMRETVIEKFIDEMNRYNPQTDTRTLEVCLKEYLKEKYHISENSLKKIYHPSMIETYPKARPNKDGIYQLKSPRINSIRNPMAMRSLFRLRKLINQLLKERKIDNETIIHIEFARELNDANKRKAMAESNRKNQKVHEKVKKEIIELYKQETGKTIEPTDWEILKYQLWEEQKHKCIYTGKEINIKDFIGADPMYDIEHTIPRSVGGDSTRMNLTLCDSRFNRETKRTLLPSELPNHDEILPRIEHWKKRYEELEKQIRKQRTTGATTKEAKDKIIQKRHLLQIERDYWKGKYERFIMVEVPEGFSRRQGTDINIISKYARLYLQSVFKKVFTIKGLATSDFRKIWGIQDFYSKKERNNHVHHCIDAIVIACIGLKEYNELAQYYHNEENHRWFGMSKASLPKPWPTFVEDLKKIQNEILVSHYTPDNMPKQGRRRFMISGKRVLCKGDAARGSLHNDTYYGAIKLSGTDKIKYVKRIELSKLKETDIKNIVDNTVRNIIEETINQKGFKTAMAEPIWMNEEKGILIKKVRCYTPSVTSPLTIRQHRDASTKEYKRQFHVMNDRNYLMAIYIGTDKKGEEKIDFELINNIQAASFYKKSNDKEAVDYCITPIKSKNDYPLAYTLKIGTMVLLYEKTPNEIWESCITEINKRLYKVVGLSSFFSDKNSYGRITLLHHEEARPSKDLKTENGAYIQGESYRASIKMLHTQIGNKALVEGYDFIINELGELKRLR